MASASVSSSIDAVAVAERGSREADRQLGLQFVLLLSVTTLLACSLVAGWLWSKPLYRALPACIRWWRSP